MGIGEAVLTSTHNLFLLSRNKKTNVDPCKSQFYCIKVGFKGSKLYRFSGCLIPKATCLDFTIPFASRKHTYIILTPLNPTYIKVVLFQFYIKLGFTGVYISFLIPAQNIDCGYSLEPPRRGGSNEYPQSMFWTEIWQISDFVSENFHFFVVKFPIYLNRHVFVMAA